MKRFCIQLAALSLLLTVFTGCDRNTFCVSGHVDAEGETLYLEHMDILKTEVLDSTVLSANGKFKFRAPRPEYPDLYRLRIGSNSLILAVDSLEHITVEAEDKLSEATVENSPKTEQIRELRRSLRDNTFEEHKDFAKKTILADPKTMVAYYALYQQKAGLPVFDIYNKEDRVYYSAVATSFNTWMPGYKRTKVLYGQVVDVINGERRAQNLAAMQAFIDESESTFLDITLPDENGDNQTLSDRKGQIIVVDFVTTRMDRYTGYVFEMKEIYNAYHSRGVEIYEVYGEQSRLLWEDQVRALPWTTVYAEENADDGVYRRFNISHLPTLFLYNRKGEIVGRYMDFESLKKGLESVL